MSDTRNAPPDLEPDDEWKQEMRKDIENGLRSMVDDAKRVLNQELEAAVVDETRRNFLTAQHLETMKTIRGIAMTQFDDALKRERRLRRWSHGLEMDDELNEALVKEQQYILDNIKKEESQTERVRIRTLDTKEGKSQGDDPPSDLERLEHTTQRPIDEPAYVPEGPSSRRPSTSSPPKMIPEFWKPTISPEEDAATSTAYAIARRGSTASTSSMGASTFRSSISSQVIQEREGREGDVAVDLTGNVEREKARLQEVDQEWNQLAKGREREKGMQYPRVDSQQNSASEFHNYRSEEFSPLPSPVSPSRNADNRSYQSSLSASRPLATKRSFTLDDANRADTRRSRIPSFTPSFATDEPTWADSRSHPPHASNRSITNQRSFSVDDTSYTDNRNHPPLANRPISNRRSFTVDESSRPDGRSHHAPSSVVTSKRSFTRDDINPVDSWNYPPPSPNRPIIGKRSFTTDEFGPGRYSQPIPKWPSAPRSPNDGRLDYGHSHSPQSSDGSPRKWHSSSIPKSPLTFQEVRYDPPNEHARPGVVEEEVEYKSDSEDDDSYDGCHIRKAEDLEVQTRRREEEARRKEEGAQKTVEEARRKEEDAKRKEEDASRKEEDAMRKAEEARLKQEEARRIEEAARLKEEETRKKEEQIRLREEEVKRREEELNRREAEARWKEEERRGEEERKRREEEERQRRAREDEKSRKEEEYRKRAEDIRRRAEERKQQEVGLDSNRMGSSFPSASPLGTAWSAAGTSPPTSPDRSSTYSSNRSSSSSTWSSSTQASSASRSSTTPTPNSKPASARADTSAMGSFPAPVPPSFPTTNQSDHEREWASRQAELAKEQQEKFRREQEKLERERQAKAATSGRIPTKEDVIRLFATHERQWAMLPNQEDLHWGSFPWPMLKMANNPTDLTEGAIGAYVGSLFHPGDKSKSMKERIKDHIRRWHPDRFDTRLLPKVVEEERAMVKEGAGAVVRSLTNLLMTNSSVHDVFA